MGRVNPGQFRLRQRQPITKEPEVTTSKFNPSHKDRADSSANAKRAALEAFNARRDLSSNDPLEAERRAARAAAASERETKRAAAEEARKARIESEKAARIALKEKRAQDIAAAALATQKKPAGKTEAKPVDPVAQKAARDARYAARKARK
jgi:hypothetical protein